MARGADPPARRRRACWRWRSRAAAAASPISSTPCCEKGRGQARLDRNRSGWRVPKPAAETPAGGRPCHRARRRERGPEQGRQGHEPALGEPEDRRPWHGHAARLDLPTGRHHLPRFSGELRREWSSRGCRARPAAPSAASGRCAICAPGAAPSVAVRKFASLSRQPGMRTSEPKLR